MVRIFFSCLELSPCAFCQFCSSTDHHGGVCKEFRVEWESVVFLGMNEKCGRGEERKRRGLRGGGVVVWWCVFVCCATSFHQGCVHSPYSFCSFIPAKHGMVKNWHITSLVTTVACTRSSHTQQQSTTTHTQQSTASPCRALS